MEWERPGAEEPGHRVGATVVAGAEEPGVLLPAMAQCDHCRKSYPITSKEAWSGKQIRKLEIGKTLKFAEERNIRCKYCGAQAAAANEAQQKLRRPTAAPPDHCVICSDELNLDNTPRNQRAKVRGDRRCTACAEIHRLECEQEIRQETATRRRREPPQATQAGAVEPGVVPTQKGRSDRHPLHLRSARWVASALCAAATRFSKELRKSAAGRTSDAIAYFHPCETALAAPECTASLESMPTQDTEAKSSRLHDHRDESWVNVNHSVLRWL